MSPRPVAPRRRRPLSLEPLEDRLVLTADPLYPVYPLPTYPPAQAIEPPASTTPPVGPLIGMPTADQGPPPPALPLPVSPTGEMPPYPMYPPTTGGSGPTGSTPATPPPLAAYPPTTPPVATPPESTPPPGDDATASAAVPTSITDLRLYQRYQAAVQLADAAYADAVIAAYTAYQAAAGVADTDHAAALDQAAIDWSDALFGSNGEALPDADWDAAGAAYDLAEAEADADWWAAEGQAWDTFRQQEQAAAIVRAVTEDAAWTAWITAGMPAGSEPNRANQISPVVGMLLGLVHADYTPTRDWARQALQMVDGGADMGEVRVLLGEMPTRPAGEPTIDPVDAVDGLFTGWAHGLAGDGVLVIRERMFGVTATRNHTGRAFALGHGVGQGHAYLLFLAGVIDAAPALARLALAGGGKMVELAGVGAVSVGPGVCVATELSLAAPGVAVATLGGYMFMMEAQPPDGGGSSSAEQPIDWEIPIEEGGAINAIGRSGNVEIEIIANMSRTGNTIILDSVHFAKNTGGTLGPKQLREFARAFVVRPENETTRSRCDW